MQPFVALLRGVNVGAANRLAMQDLCAIAEGIGWEQVTSHVASGNLVFLARGLLPEALGEELTVAVREHSGIDLPVLVMRGGLFRQTVHECPFPRSDGRQVHAFFTWRDIALDKALLDAVRAHDETLVARGRVAWLLAPEGIGRSRLAERMERVLGVPATGRNLNTLRSLAQMLDDLAPG